jgi:hypothetical protein
MAKRFLAMRSNSASSLEVFGMATYSKRAFHTAEARVGRFLRYWANVEDDINRAIEKAFGFDSLSAVVICSNMLFRDKIHCLRTALNMQYLPQPPEITWDKLLLAVNDFSLHNRNMVVHNVFGPTQEKEVKFLVVKAKGKLSFPPTIWSKKDFDDKVKQMLQFQTYLVRLIKLLPAEPVWRKQKPTPQLLDIILGSPLAHLPPDSPLLDMSLATQSKESETPPKPEEK